MQIVAPRCACDAANASRAAVAAAGAPYRSRWCETDGQRVHAVGAGDGPVVLFVHGFPAMWYCWIRQMEALRTTWHVIAIDAPGAGASDRPADPARYGVGALAAAIDGVVGHLAAGQRVVLVGHDWGAALAFAYAQAHPDRLAGVVGMCAPPVNMFLELFAADPAQQARSGYMQRLRELDAAGAAGLAPGLAARAYHGLVERGVMTERELACITNAVEDPGALLAGAAWYRANVPAPGNVAARWPADDPPLGVPALLVWGDADQTFVPDLPGRFAQRHPGADVLHLPEVGHWPMFEATHAVNAALAGFLERPDVVARRQGNAA